MSDIESLKFETILKDVMGEERKATTIKSMETFIQNELTFWKEIKTKHNFDPINHMITQFNNAVNELNSFKTNYQNANEQQKEQHLNRLLNRVTQHVKTTSYSGTPLTHKLIEICPLGQQQTLAFWNYVAKQGNGQLPGNQWGHLEGLVIGYEYLFQDENQITKRRDSERKALSALRTSLNEKTDEVIGKTDEFMQQIDEWKSGEQKELANDRESYKSEQTDFLANAEERLSNQLEQDETNRTEFFNQAKGRLDELETLYREKLRLEPAATYWSKRASKLMWAGRGFGALMLATTLTVGVGFGWLFLEWLESGKVIEKFTAMHWQGVVVLIAAITMAIFLVRVLGKLTFSSFHLQRDAEERELLSYLYLALSKDGNVNEESRHVVLQSLFSRADTGLLAGDHGPTLPVAEVVQKLRS